MDMYQPSTTSQAKPVLTSHSISQDATCAMIERARMLVNQFIRERGHAEPPFLAEELAELQGVNKIVKTDLREIDALLLRSTEGYVIKLNATHRPERQNFSCAHEIGHILLDELAPLGATDSAEFRTLNSDISARAKERLCQAAAAELLMPEVIFRKYLQGFGVSVNSINRLARVFRVSNEPAAIRIGEVSIEPCITIIWKRFQKARSKGFIGRLNGKATYVRDPSALLKAYETDSPVKSFKSFEIGGTRDRCLMESKGFGRDKWRYVISLIFPERQCKA